MFSYRKNQPAPSQERGVTLVEVMMVLGIATAFIAGGLALYNNAQQGLIIRDATSRLLGSAADVRGQFAAAVNYNALTGAALSDFDNPFGAGVNYFLEPVGTAGDERNAILVVNGVPEDACQRIENALTGAVGFDAEAFGIAAAGTAMTANGDTSPGTSVVRSTTATTFAGVLPATPAACGAAEAQNYIVIYMD